MHETTRALLRHLRDLPQVADPRLDWLFVNAWDAAGYPDLDAPEPDRLAELEARIKALGPVSALYERLTGLEEDMAGWEERLKALERPTAPPAPPPEPEFMPTTPGRYIRNPSSGFQTVDVWRGTDGVLRWGPMLRVDDPLTACWVGPAPAAPPPEPARFVPTEPGWYWVEQPDGRRYPAWWEPGFGRNAMHWLGPVAPYAPPTRTEEEARREPRRGDRWKCSNGAIYTLVRPWLGEQWYALEEGREVQGLLPGGPLGHETYLGNFAHELEAP